MTRTQDITTALRSLDAADSDIDPASGRARTELQRILATDPHQRPAPTRRASLASATRRPRRRFVLAGGMVAAVTAAVAVLPTFAGGDKAFASWTRDPEAMTEEQRAEAAAGCRESQEGVVSAQDADELGTADAVIAERRGVWTTVVLAGSDGFSALCVTDDSTRLFAKDMIGSVGTPAGYTAPGPRDVVATSLGTGTMRAGKLSLAAGEAGSDVTAIVYRSRGHGRVTATVSQGHFAVWLPGNELEAASGDGVEIEVTYRDGSTATSVLTL